LTDTHDDWTPRFQAHSRAALMLSVPVPPPAPNCNGAAVAETWHLVAEGAVTDVDVDVQAIERAADADRSAQQSETRKRIRSTCVS